MKIKYTIASSVDETINDPETDCVIICTPSYLNKLLTIQTLNAGKHVLCGKLPALFSHKKVLLIKMIIF